MKTTYKTWLAIFVMGVLIGTVGFSAAFHERQSDDLMKSVKSPARTPVVDHADPVVTSAFHRFSQDLLVSAGTRAKENLMVSPLSVYLALAMTVNGAQGTTQQEMLGALATGASLEEMNRSASYWIGKLATKEKDTELSIANSIWIQHDYRVARPFLEKNAQYYDASARLLDFSRQDAPKVINDWVSKMTKGKITSIIDRTSADMLMILANASYFKSDWDEPFEASDTYDRTFQTSAGPLETPFMHAARPMVWLDRSQAQGIMLPYKGKRFWFFALLPDADIPVRTWLARQDANQLFTGLANTSAVHMQEVELAIPPFTATYADTLAQDLQAMGMTAAFKPNTADFSLMSDQGTRDLFISDVLHKTFIQVDEEGTEAAAVTAVMMKATAYFREEVKLIVFDRPFFYGIMDIETGLPLFIGILDKPVASSP